MHKTHLVNMLRPELHLWEHVWLYKKIREGLGHSLTFLLRQPYAQKHTPGRSTDLFRLTNQSEGIDTRNSDASATEMGDRVKSDFSVSYNTHLLPGLKPRFLRNKTPEVKL